MQFLVMLSLFCALAIPQTRNVPAGFVVLNGDYQVRAQGYNIYPIRIPAGKIGVLSGRLAVQGSASQDAELCVFDQPNVELFANRQMANAVYCSGRVKLQTFEVVIPAGNYNILLNNSYSILTAKTVRVFAGLRFEDVNSARKSFKAEEPDEIADNIFDSDHKLVALKGLFPDPGDCNISFKETAIVTDTHYKEEELEYFTVKLAEGKRKNVYIKWERLSNAARGSVHVLIKEGNRLLVKGFVCGNGGYWYADEITKK